MKQISRRKHRAVTPVIIAIAALMIGAAVSAGEFVSFKGQFKITFPENWTQVDYRTADLRIGQAGGDLGYDAAFSCSDDPVAFEGRYFILTVDTAGNLTAQQVDSAISGVATDFGKPVREISSDMFLVNPPIDAVSYCPQLKAAAVVSQLDAGTPLARTSVVLRKFYDRGTADFYLYAPDSVLAEALADLQTILASFTTENLTTSASAPAKVGDIEEEKPSAVPRNLIVVIVGAILLAAIVIWLLRRKNASK
jgi:hypothetical protein